MPASDLASRFGRRPLALRERLEAIANEVRAASPDDMAVIDRFVARLEAAGSGAKAPSVGEALPPFMMPDHEGRLVSTAALIEEGPLVVVFHRGHWCPYCRTTIAAIAEAQAHLAPAQIVAISAETQRYTRRIRSQSRANFRFLSDIDAEYASGLDLTVQVDPALRQILEEAGKRVPDFHGSKGWILLIPAVFVLDAHGIVRARHVDPDYRRRMEIDDLIAAVRNLAHDG
jgi:peroxiredoxin